MFLKSFVRQQQDAYTRNDFCVCKIPLRLQRIFAHNGEGIYNDNSDFKKMYMKAGPGLSIETRFQSRPGVHKLLGLDRLRGF